MINENNACAWKRSTFWNTIQLCFLFTPKCLVLYLRNINKIRALYHGLYYTIESVMLMEGCTFRQKTYSALIPFLYIIALKNIESREWLLTATATLIKHISKYCYKPRTQLAKKKSLHYGSSCLLIISIIIYTGIDIDGVQYDALVQTKQNVHAQPLRLLSTAAVHSTQI